MSSSGSGEPLYWVGARRLAHAFPPLEHALDDPNGLIAIGGDLSPSRLLDAYARGIFPWFNAGQPILWWSPDPRAVTTPGAARISRSLAKRLRRATYRISFDAAFAAVIAACAAPGPGRVGTWITPAMHDAYCALHARGYAHSVECWHGRELVGGLYGVALGQVFFGESMFSRAPDASKVAFVNLHAWLLTWGYTLIDCQLPTAHLATLGVQPLARAAFEQRLRAALDASPAAIAWRQEPAR